jgi:hypothetical protein
MKIGLVGFPGCGKTTVFNALTGMAAETGYGAAKGKTNLGTVKVPDARVDALAKLYSPKKTVYAEITFCDVAVAAVAGAGKGLDEQILRAMREVDALCHVVRGFPSSTGDAPSPLTEAQDFEAEMNLSDLILVENRLDRVKKEKAKAAEKELLDKLKAHLDAGKPLRTLEGLSVGDLNLISGFRFLSQKPLLLIYNVDEAKAAQPAPADLADYARTSGLGLIVLAGTVEMDIAQMAPEEQKEFVASLGLSEPASNRFIRAAYALCDLISFLTAGEDECRAWPLRKGSNAHRAAGKIHSDIERGFIRAEVIPWEELVKHGSEAKCREVGKLRLEGKEYVVADGDVINFRFNV